MQSVSKTYAIIMAAIVVAIQGIGDKRDLLPQPQEPSLKIVMTVPQTSSAECQIDNKMQERPYKKHSQRQRERFEPSS